MALWGRIGSIKPAELIRLVESLGRKRGNRGKEPTWVPNPKDPTRRPISIPCHPGTLKKGTAKGILLQIEEDIETLEQRLENESEGNGKDNSH